MFRQGIGTHFIITREIRSPGVVRELVAETARRAGQAGKFQWWRVSDLSRSKNSYGRFSLADLERLEEVLTSHVAGFSFERPRAPYARLDVHFSTRTSSPKDPNLLNYDVEEAYYREPETQAARIDSLLDTVVSLARTTQPLFGRTHPDADMIRITPELAGLYWDRPGFIPSVYWGTYFGPSLVARFGLDRLLGAPVWRACKVSEDGALLVLTPSPLNPHSKESREKQMDLINYLGISDELRMVYLKAYAENEKNAQQLEQAIGRKLWRKPYEVTGIPWLE